MKDIKIYIAAHKKFVVPKDDVYIPLHVGAKGKESLGYQSDAEGDNISDKNSSYCELTGMYWMWKHAKADIIGLVHYRRYFFKKFFNKSVDNILSRSDIEELMEKYDIIVPLRGFTYKRGSVYDQYNYAHTISDLDLARDVIKEIYPEYMEAYNKVMNGSECVQYNMIITRKEIYDEYCEWLFNVLFKVEERETIKLEDRDAYNRRVYGFLSERLFNVWAYKNNQYKIHELPVYNVEADFKKEEIRAIVKKVFFIRNKRLYK